LLKGLLTSEEPARILNPDQEEPPPMRKPAIQSDPAIMMGKPVIAGTRITVELILEKLAAGEPIDQILEAHPRLTREDIQAALAQSGGAVYEL
jgi:uncharacterized protein (DUF433 family)